MNIGEGKIVLESCDGVMYVTRECENPQLEIIMLHSALAKAIVDYVNDGEDPVDVAKQAGEALVAVVADIVNGEVQFGE